MCSLGIALPFPTEDVMAPVYWTLSEWGEGQAGSQLEGDSMPPL